MKIHLEQFHSTPSKYKYIIAQKWILWLIEEPMMLWRTDYERILFARNINFAILRIVFSEEE